MSRTAWESLVEKYADGRPICNCRQAYYTPCGTGAVMENGRMAQKTDMLACQYGCSANQLFCKDEIAAKVVAELSKEKPDGG